MTQRHHKLALYAVAAGVFPTLCMGSAGAADIFLQLQPARADGQVHAALYAATDREWSEPLQSVVGPAAGLRFSEVPPGRYAVQLFIDLNGDDQLQLGRRGLPQEPVGFSGQLAAPRRKPTPEEVAFEHGEQDTQAVVHLRSLRKEADPAR